MPKRWKTVAFTQLSNDCWHLLRHRWESWLNWPVFGHLKDVPRKWLELKSPSSYSWCSICGTAVYRFCSKRAWYGQTYHDFTTSRQLLWFEFLVSVSTFHFKQMLILKSNQYHEHSAVSLAERLECGVWCCCCCCCCCCFFSTTASLSLQSSLCAWPGVLALHNVRMELRRGIVRPGEVPSFPEFDWTLGSSHFWSSIFIHFHWNSCKHLFVWWVIFI